MTDHYEKLGVPKDASLSDIKNAYRVLARKYHPDKNRDLDQEQVKVKQAEFILVQEAYTILSDPEEKTKYDRKIGKVFMSKTTQSHKYTRSAFGPSTKANPFSAFQSKPNVPKPRGKTFYHNFSQFVDENVPTSRFGNPNVHSFAGMEGPRAQRQKMQGPFGRKNKATFDDFTVFSREGEDNGEKMQQRQEEAKDGAEKMQEKDDTVIDESPIGDEASQGEKVEIPAKHHLFEDSVFENPMPAAKNKKSPVAFSHTSETHKSSFQHKLPQFQYKAEAAREDATSPEMLAKIDDILKKDEIASKRQKPQVFKTHKKMEMKAKTRKEAGKERVDVEQDSEEEIVYIDDDEPEVPEEVSPKKSKLFGINNISNIPPFTQNNPHNFDFEEIGSTLGFKRQKSSQPPSEPEVWEEFGTSGTNIISTPVNSTLPRVHDHGGRILHPSDLAINNLNITKPRPPSQLQELTKNAWYIYQKDVHRYQNEWMSYCKALHMLQIQRITAIGAHSEDIFSQFSNSQIYTEGIKADLELQRQCALVYHENMMIMEQYYKNILLMNGKTFS